MSLSISTKYFKAIAFVSGAASLSLELLVTRALHPYFGASAYIWTVVLSASLLGITAGYFAAAFYSRKINSERSVFYLLLVANGLLLMFSVIYPSLIRSFSVFGLIAGASITSFFLLFIPLFLLGMVSPLLIGMDSVKSNAAGSAGKIFSVSTLGGIIMILLFGFYGIENLGISACIKILGAAGLLVALVAAHGLKGKDKMKYALPFLFVLLPPVHDTVAGELKYSSEGMYGEVKVIDIKNENENEYSERLLLVNGMGQTWVNYKRNQSKWVYVDYITSVASIFPPGSKVLLIGLAGGKLADQLSRTVKHNVTAVELDPRMKGIAEEYFALDANVDVIIDDGRHHLKTSEDKFDVIIFDVFSGDIPPSHLLSVEAFVDAKQRLNESGLIIVNFNGFRRGKASVSGRSVFKSLQAAGLTVKALATYGGTEQTKNNIFIASEKFPDLSQPALLLNVHGKPANFNDSLFVFKDESGISAYELHDNAPKLEIINYEASYKWREDYNKRIKLVK